MFLEFHQHQKTWKMSDVFLIGEMSGNIENLPETGRSGKIRP